MDDRLAKLKALSQKREESIQLNRQDVVQEHKQKEYKKLEQQQVQLDKKQDRAQKVLDEREAKKEGLDLEREKGLVQYTIEDVERWQELQQEKKDRAQVGFTDYAQVAAKKYQKLTKQMKPNLKEYQSKKKEQAEQLSALASASVDLGASAASTLYRDANSLTFATAYNKPKPEAVNKMVSDLNQQLEQRKKISKRRAYNDDEDVTYINERNMRFNKKVARAYDKYTKDMKDSFERGTALD